ncbi:MAG: PHP domain-containing protein [Betaproteobacteria bacterium]|nr:PHP domain-containing protein [Betaproteobacteria bacterium]
MHNIDLHCHSTFSDGALTPVQLVERAARRGVDALALTDHDETGGLPEARAAAAAAGIVLIDGVEISVSWNGHTLHVVGVHVDPANAALAAGLAQIRLGRAQRAERIAAELESVGIGGSLEGARACAANPDLVGRAHFARYLVARGCARDVKAAFNRYLAQGKPGYVAHQWTTLERAVSWINGSSGIAVLAHPGRYRLSDAGVDDLLGEFSDLGGAAVEVVTGGHTPAQYALFAGKARRFGLAASVGSDFHAPAESCDLGRLPALPPGCVPVWRDWNTGTAS